MKLASVLTPLSHENLTLAAQTGVDEIVVRYPGPDLSVLDDVQARIESYGMRLGVVEGYLPIENIKLGRDDGTEMAQMKTLVRHLGEIGVPLICYNFMAGTDWIRTSVDCARAGWGQGDGVRPRRPGERPDPRPRAVPGVARAGSQAPGTLEQSRGLPDRDHSRRRRRRGRPGDASRRSTASRNCWATTGCMHSVDGLRAAGEPGPVAAPTRSPSARARSRRWGSTSLPRSDISVSTSRTSISAT